MTDERNNYTNIEGRGEIIAIHIQYTCMYQFYGDRHYKYRPRFSVIIAATLNGKVKTTSHEAFCITVRAYALKPDWTLELELRSRATLDCERRCKHLLRIRASRVYVTNSFSYLILCFGK